MPAIEAGAEDVAIDDDVFEVLTEPSDLTAVRAALDEAGVEIESADVAMRAQEHGRGREATTPKLLKLLDALDDKDDVDEVYANFDIPAEVLEQLAADRAAWPPRSKRQSTAAGIRRPPRITPMQVVLGHRPRHRQPRLRRRRVEGSHMVALDGGVVETSPERRWSAGSQRDPPRAGRADRLARAEGDGDRGGLLRQERALGDRRRPGPRRRDARRRRSAAIAVLRLHAAGDQGRRLRLRPRRQGPGRSGWSRRCCACRSCRRPTTRPTRSPSPSATSTARRCRRAARSRRRAPGRSRHMIAMVRGEVAVRRPDHVVVDCRRRRLPPRGLRRALRRVPAAGKQVTLHAHLVVREDALNLYGFATEEERDLFLLLIGVQDVGPKVALAVLSGASPRELQRALAGGHRAPAGRARRRQADGGAHRGRAAAEVRRRRPDHDRPRRERRPAHARPRRPARARLHAAGGRPAARRRLRRAARGPHRPRAQGGASPRRGRVAGRAREAAACRGLQVPDATEEDLDVSLRPRRLADFVGQQAVKSQLSVSLEAATAAATRSTTCCSPGRRASARRRSRRSSPRSWASTSCRPRAPRSSARGTSRRSSPR